MSYIYDIILNFNKELIEYFEWEDSDDIKYVKKVALFKTDTNLIKDLINYEIVFDNKFTSSIPNYEITRINGDCKIFLLTDGLIVIGVLIKENNSILLSRLLLDEEYEILDMANHLPFSRIGYKKSKKIKRVCNDLTRKENGIREKLSKVIAKLYKENKKDELLYLYYEFTNKECKSIDYAYNYLKNSLKSFNEDHIRLFDIVMMSKTFSE